MTEETTNYGFNKRQIGHPVRDTVNASNMDLIDAAIKDRENEYDAHDPAKTGIHSVGSDYIAKVSTSDQLVRVADIPSSEFDVANKIPKLDGSGYLKLSQISGLHDEGTSSFAGSGGVTITHNLNLSNYAPTIIPTADGGGAIGDVWITDIAVNSFVVRNTGSAVTAFTWIIHNRT